MRIIGVMTGEEDTFAENAIPVRDENFSLEELDGDLLLFNPGNGRLLELNSTAALVWQLCSGARSVAEICALLGAAYPDSAAAIAGEVPAILHRLDDLGALYWIVSLE